MSRVGGWWGGGVPDIEISEYRRRIKWLPVACVAKKNRNRMALTIVCQTTGMINQLTASPLLSPDFAVKRFR